VKKARIINLCFQAMAAFWAVIVITKTRTSVTWHAYVIAAVGVIVISVVGTRLKHRIIARQKAISAGASASAT
jgi:uncharacterized membrane protein YfcA